MSTAHEPFRDATPHSGAHTPPPTQAEFRAEHESLGEMFQSLSAKLSTLVSQEIALAKAEADRLGVNDGALISLTVAGQALRLPLRIDEQLGAGLIGLPVGFAGIPAAIAGATATGLQEAAQ